MIKDSKKTVLCYGDSNTWGAIPNSDFRYGRDIRWTSVLQNLAGIDYEIISEGLCGRTLKSAIASPEKNGINYILPCILSHDPLDWVLIMLGTNDVKDKYCLSVEDIANNLRETISIIKSADIGNPKIIVICPPAIVVPDKGPDSRLKDGIEKFKKLPGLYKLVAEENRCLFINAGEYITSSKLDGIHLDKEAHTRLADIIWKVIKSN